MMFQLNVPTNRGVVLNGVLFRNQKERKADTVMIAITGIHGNFYSNPFYYNIGDTLNGGDIDFIYAQTNNAFSEIPTVNVRTGKEETIGSWNERFSYTDDDLDAYITFAQQEGYKHIILGGHSLGANKVIYYLSRHHDERVEHFFLLSPANLTYMMSGVTNREKTLIKEQVERGDGDKMLPFPFMGWVTCIADTAWDWQFSNLLNNVHTAKDGDFSQASAVSHTGALLVGTYDNFTDGDPSDFLRNLNAHMPTAKDNSLIFIEKTGHTYQMKHQEVADKILAQLQEWRAA
ncbi:MAG: alpha/beta fold hydrolase [Megasphaera massiliensis]|uniref:alpha/beta fold hydrolase n=1 Tax=Megasphaera massiliensis TaxID=1232428 RepID=UPI00210C1E8D|nr:alpha/beta fold hydrolase [Megasphaera massiliensis]MCQ5209672.1 alpha/beta fold hydrolase [Megasphaera massiliensis]MEE0658178.1 alpha/beta fold hydrolase [Megasphaera massiliensis]